MKNWFHNHLSIIFLYLTHFQSQFWRRKLIFKMVIPEILFNHLPLINQFSTERFKARKKFLLQMISDKKYLRKFHYSFFLFWPNYKYIETLNHLKPLGHISSWFGRPLSQIRIIWYHARLAVKIDKLDILMILDFLQGQQRI